MSGKGKECKRDKDTTDRITSHLHNRAAPKAPPPLATVILTTARAASQPHRGHAPPRHAATLRLQISHCRAL